MNKRTEIKVCEKCMDLMEPPFEDLQIFDMHCTKLLKVCRGCRHKYFVDLKIAASKV